MNDSMPATAAMERTHRADGDGGQQADLPGMPRPSSYLSPALIGLDCPDKGGKAVYARDNVARGSILVVWGGSVLTGAELLAGPAAQRRLTVQVGEDTYLVSDVEGPADWINHSCEPNAGLQGQITLVALRDIRTDEEICFDYAMSDGSGYDEFDCRCGAASCRGRVTGDDWTRPDISARYRGYFSPYLERRMWQNARGVGG